jgi:1-acyl-sn-glycerol-3-phosphate acyltransferase
LKIIFYRIIYPLIRPFYLVFLIINTVGLALLIIMVSPFDRRRNIVHYIGKFWALLNVYLSGTKLTIRGKEKIAEGSSYVVMSNHQSLFDVWALIGMLPLQLRWIIKSDIMRVPIFGYALDRMGHIYVDRKGPRKTSRGVEEALRTIEKKACVVVFPEGTRSKDGHLGKFRTGGSLMAIKSGVPILPVTVNGSRFVLPRDTLALMPGKIQVVVGDVIDPSAYDENGKNELTAVLKSVIQRNLDLEYGTFT